MGEAGYVLTIPEFNNIALLIFIFAGITSIHILRRRKK
jgi:hypothetical protein